MVALFSSVGKLALLIPVLEGFGQLRWNWYAMESPKPLNEFELFDQASRGAAWGCLKLLVLLKGRYVICSIAMRYERDQ